MLKMLTWLLIACFSLSVSLADQQVLPKVLTLQQALSLVQPGNPALASIDANIAMHKAATLSSGASAFRQKQLNALQAQRMAIGHQSELDTARAFFDVIISDYAYAAMHEEMTLAYLRFDRARDAKARDDSVTEANLIRLETVYLDAFAERGAINHEQRASRLRLALALGQPQSYPDQMVEPTLDFVDREDPDYEALLARVFDNNPEIRAARLWLESEQQSLVSLQKQQSDEMSLAMQRARVQQHQATQIELEMLYREHVLSLAQQVEQLKLELNAADSELLYREIDLDNVRLQYEMEIRAYIGSANTDVAKALLRQVRVRYALAMAWMEIDQLTQNWSK